MKITLHWETGDVQVDLSYDEHRAFMFELLGRMESASKMEKLEAQLDKSNITLISGD